MLNGNIEKSTTIYEYTILEIFHHLHSEDKYVVVYWVDYKTTLLMTRHYLSNSTYIKIYRQTI